MAPQSIIEVLAALRQVVADESRVGSRLCLFPALYAELTQRLVQALANDEFEHPTELEQIAVRFAQRYFDALEAFRRGDKPTKSWRVAFQEARVGRMLMLQDLMLGINAHINLDLAIATADVAGPRIDAFERDFLRINDLLEELFARTEDVISAHSPLLDVLDRLGGEHDAYLGTFVITRARDAAWANAKVLVHLDASARGPWIGMLDMATSRLGHMIAYPGVLVQAAVDLVRNTEERDVRVLVEALSHVQP
jgi:hypothetical protein